MSDTGRAATPLPVRFFARRADVVAQALLGQVIASKVGGLRTAGRIVETEAYLGGEDPASHAFGFRRTDRNRGLFGPHGTWYVYRSYGIHWCANLVCAPRPAGGAVLLRALEPIEGIEVMRERRGGRADRELCAGPGRLCQALGITRALDEAPMASSEVVVLRGEAVPRSRIAATPRIGITKAAGLELRYTVSGSRWLSAPIPRR
ncbi:MAG: DNA-3-methyladenine glycosylase [Gemmatimonadales bacterium]